MKRVVVRSPGGYEKLRLEECDTPSPGPGQVLVATRAVGVNYADCCVRWGVYESAKEYVGWPIVPGFEFSGHVAAVGRGVDAFREGDPVFGVTRFDAYASHVVVPASQVFPLPSRLSMEEAGGFSATSLTAYHAIYQLVRLRRGGTVLVHSAAGGVGSALLQLAKREGMTVVGVVGRAEKVAFAEDHGADHVIDKSSQPLWRAAKEHAPHGFDAVFDANGYTTFRGSFRALAPTGKLVVYGSHAVLPKKGGRIRYLKAGWGLLNTPRFNPFELISKNKSVVGFNLSFLFDRGELLSEAMVDLLGALDAEEIRAPRITTFTLEEVAKAHAFIESGTSTGKLVLTV